MDRQGDRALVKMVLIQDEGRALRNPLLLRLAGGKSYFRQVRIKSMLLSKCLSNSLSPLQSNRILVL